MFIIIIINYYHCYYYYYYYIILYNIIYIHTHTNVCLGGPIHLSSPGSFYFQTRHKVLGLSNIKT